MTNTTRRLFLPATLEEINAINQNTLAKPLGITITEVGDDFVEGTMPVDKRTHQPHGVLHGGASVALAETLGSVASSLTVDPTQYRCVGIEINANHLRPVASGIVTGRATPLHLGRTTQVWEIRIVSEEGKLVCISRLTIAVLKT